MSNDQTQGWKRVIQKITLKKDKTTLEYIREERNEK